MFNTFLYVAPTTPPEPSPPIIVGGVDISLFFWGVVFVVYAGVLIYAITSLRHTKTREADINNNQSSMRGLVVQPHKRDGGSSYWTAASLEVEGVVGVGNSPDEAINDLFHQISVQESLDHSYKAISFHNKNKE